MKDLGFLEKPCYHK